MTTENILILITVLIIIISMSFVFIGGFILYPKFGWFKLFFHDLLGWHEPDETKEIYNVGINTHATCKHCGEDIIQDSQGNWF